MPRVRGDKIRAEYSRRGFKLADVAQATNIRATTLTNALCRSRHPLDQSKINRLADFLGWDPGELIDPDAQPEPNPGTGPKDNRPPTKPGDADDLTVRVVA